MGRCKSPKIFIGIDTLIHVARVAEGGKNGKSVNEVLLSFLIKSHFSDSSDSTSELFQKMIDHVEKVNLHTKEYNLYGVKVPIEIIDEDNNIYIIDQGTMETFGMRIFR